MSKPNSPQGVAITATDGVTAEGAVTASGGAAAVLEALGAPPEAGTVYELALTHRSFAHEQPAPVPHNERLEFLGDAVLGLIVADLIYRSYPELPEGDMARLRASVVNAIAFAELAGALGLGEHIRLGRGEEGSGGRHKASVLADAFEALVGAAFLDRGIDAVREVLEPIFTFQLDEIIDAGGGQDAKGLLQEVAAREHAALPSYNVAASGPDHDKRFVAHVYVADELYGAGTGRSKKSAEQGAAREALDRIQGALGDRPMRIMSAQAPEDVAGGRR